MNDNIKKNAAYAKELIVNFLIPLVALILIGALGFFVIYPYFRDSPSLKSELTQKTNLKASLQKKIDNLNRLVDFKQSVDENSNLVNKILPYETNIPQLLDETYQIATNAGTKVNKLSYSYAGSTTSGSSGDGPKYINVSLGVEGTFEQLLVMLKNIENAARLVNVSEIRYYKFNAQDANSNVLSAQLSLDAPYMFVQSSAVTDDPVDMDISSSDFINFINKIKGFQYYEFSNQGIGVINEAPKTLESGSENNSTVPVSSAQ